ncbi:hypothetical protein K7432_014823 [Basidiobolus ranarum]|uniref:Uncharacterized protein n=1 Tax=Basidiobolus ranarum TaxID=34480 RepID=A0ABR2VPT7_9FUNG
MMYPRFNFLLFVLFVFMLLCLTTISETAPVPMYATGFSGEQWSELLRRDFDWTFEDILF